MKYKAITMTQEDTTVSLNDSEINRSGPSQFKLHIGERGLGDINVEFTSNAAYLLYKIIKEFYEK
jgi:hypothetical protein